MEVTVAVAAPACPLPALSLASAASLFASAADAPFPIMACSRVTIPLLMRASSNSVVRAV